MNELVNTKNEEKVEVINKETNVNNSKAKQEKIVYIEILRIIACFLVIVNHTNSKIFLNSQIGDRWFASITYFLYVKWLCHYF